MVCRCTMDRPGRRLDTDEHIQNIYAAELYILQDRFGFTF